MRNSQLIHELIVSERYTKDIEEQLQGNEGWAEGKVKTGVVNIQELMNSNSTVKTQIGQDNLDKMNNA